MLTLAPGQERRAALELARQLGLIGARVERRILAKDGLLQLTKLRPGADSDGVDQSSARLAIRLHRLRLTSGAIEGEHALGMEALVRRMLGDQRIELRDDLPVPPRGQFGFDRCLDRQEVELLEPADLRRRKRLARDIGERGAAPKLERALGGAVGDPLRCLATGAIHEALELHGVHGVIWDLELVAAAVGNDLRLGSIACEQLAQPRDVELDVLRRAQWRTIVPKGINQLVGANGPVGAQGE